MEPGLFAGSTPTTGRYASVVLERGIDSRDGLTYAIPTHLADLRLGDRVVAPIGRADTPAEGVVVRLTDVAEVDPARIKPLIRRTGGWFPEPLVQLARWMASYYCSPIGMVLAAMVPVAVKRQTGRITRTLVERTGAEPVPPIPPTVARAWKAICSLPEGEFPMEPRPLADRIGARTIGPINRLVERGVLREVIRHEVRAGWAEWASPPPQNLIATGEQAKAIRAMIASLGRFERHLLFGVTGSGKTEVYLQVLEAVIRQGRSAIVLVPEISLTPQTAGRFIGRFLGQPEVGVAVLHSGLTASQRHDQWSRVAQGRARVVVGARSAIFAPFSERTGVPLGLIIVDEEHDSSYKQDQVPRYHARDVALKRGQLEGCPVVLGSATPSLESWHNASAGRFQLHRLSERVGGGSLPRVEIVDLVEERKNRAEDRRQLHALGPRLERAIRDELARREAAEAKEGGSIILLLNRRGYASYISCPDARCGWLMNCDHCDVTMVYHRRPDRHEGGLGGEPESTRGFVQCHHCLAQVKLPRLCPSCGKRVNTFGFGTQRLEEELERKFPGLRRDETFARLDSDVMRRARDYFDTLERFRTGDLQLIMGTQMIAKGLDYPSVRLIGVVNADTAIALPDFRAAERTFQLVSQVVGRAGRSVESGGVARAIVQTMNPEEPAIQLAARHDYERFAVRELKARREAALPPIGRMARIVVRDRDSTKADQLAWEIVRSLEAHASVGQGEVRVRGPMFCPISRIAGKYRISIELMAESAALIQRTLTALRNAGLVRSDARTAVDVDPVMLL